MKWKVVLLLFACAVSHGIAAWAAWHNQSLCNAATIAGALALAVAIVTLFRHKGDRTFKVGAWLVIVGYLSFWAIELWLFYTSAD